MNKPIHKDLNRIKAIAVLQAIEHNCKYNIVIFNHVHGRFDEDRSTYEIVADSYFETDRPHVLKLYDTDDLLQNLSDHFDPGMIKVLETNRQHMKDLRDPKRRFDNPFDQARNIPIIDPYRSIREESPAPGKVVTVIKTEPDVGRNDPCPCHSGRKYKHCCLNKK